MGAKRVRVFDNERLDLEDAQAIIDYALRLTDVEKLNLLSANSVGMVFTGFEAAAIAGTLNVRFSGIGAALDSHGRLIQKETGSPNFDYALVDNSWNLLSLYYVEADTDQDSRKRWDSTSAAEESVLDYTRLQPYWNLYNLSFGGGVIPIPTDPGFSWPTVTADIMAGRYDGNFVTETIISGQSVGLIPVCMVYCFAGIIVVPGPGLFAVFDRRPTLGRIADTTAYPATQTGVVDPFPHVFRTGSGAAPDPAKQDFGIPDLRSSDKALAYALRQFGFRDSANAVPGSRDREGKHWWDWYRSTSEANSLSSTPYVASTPITGLPTFPNDVRGLMELDNDAINAYKDERTGIWQTTLFNSRSAAKSVFITVAKTGHADFVGEDALWYALQYMSAGGYSGTIQVRSGSYTLTQVNTPGTLAGVVLIRGEGSNTVVDAGSIAAAKFIDSNGAVLEDIVITGNSTSSVVYCSDYLYINRCTIGQLGTGYAVRTVGANLKIRDSLVYSTNFAIHVNGYSYDIQGTTILGKVEAVSAVEGLIRNCSVTAIPAAGMFRGIYLNGTVSNVVLSDVTVSGFDECGIYIDSSLMSFIKVQDCHVTGNGLNISTHIRPTGGIVIVTQGGTMRCVHVEGNTVLDNVVGAGPAYTQDEYGHYGIFVGNTSFSATPFVTDIHVNDNIVSGNGLLTASVALGTPAGGPDFAEQEIRRLFSQIAVSSGLWKQMSGADYEYSNVTVSRNHVTMRMVYGFGVFVTGKPYVSAGLKLNWWYKVAVDGNIFSVSDAAAAASTNRIPWACIAVEVLGVPGVGALPGSLTSGIKDMSIRGNLISDNQSIEGVTCSLGDTISLTAKRGGVGLAYWLVDSLNISGNTISSEQTGLGGGNKTIGINFVAGQVATFICTSNQTYRLGGPTITIVAPATGAAGFNEHNITV